MSGMHGAFVWHELMTTDIIAAGKFYAAVVGWTVQKGTVPGMEYAEFKAGERMVAGMMTLPEEAKAMGAPPMWTGYVAVDDVDAATRKVAALGGRIYRPAHDIPNVGRFSVVADPQGATFNLFKFATPPQGAPAAMGTPGTVGWNELYALDLDKAFAFYTDMFGWTKSTAIDMGPMGTYQLFAHNGKDIGGMMNKPPNVPVALWGYYFNVENIDAAVARVTANGGKVVNGPMQVPGGAWIAQALDPQGVMFAVVGPRA